MPILVFQMRLLLMVIFLLFCELVVVNTLTTALVHTFAGNRSNVH